MTISGSNNLVELIDKNIPVVQVSCAMKYSFMHLALKENQRHFEPGPFVGKLIVN